MCELKSSEAKSFPFTDLSTHVNLTVTEDYRLEIAYEELSVTESDVVKLLQPAPRQHNRERSSDTSHSQFASDDGLARIEVRGTGPESSQQNADGLSRSSRTRRAVFFNS